MTKENDHALPQGIKMSTNGDENEIAIKVDGFLINQIKNALELEESTFNGIKVQAINFISKVVKFYCSDIAIGEVGASGSRLASNLPPTSGRCPVGLLYGRIQSGKTLGMIISSALAIDNGFRIIVIFTSNNVKLVEQTYKRFDIGAKGILIKTSADRKNETRWSGDVEHIKYTLDTYPEYGLVLICQKESKHLEDLKIFLESIHAPKYPVLLMDDEADQATPDTNTRRRATIDSTVAPSKTFSQIVWTPEEESILQLLPHHIFVQVTATPYALLLQNVDAELKPRFCELLEPGNDYTGGEEFFENKHIDDDGAPPLVFVDGSELAEPRESEAIPGGLSKAVHYFLLASIVQDHLSAGKKYKVKNFLCHTSFKKDEHTFLGSLIKNIVEKISREVNTVPFDTKSITNIRLTEAFEELSKTISVGSLPNFDILLNEIKMIIPLRQVLVINSAVDSDIPEKGLNFLIGGNILGRGLTIDNLLVTYYMRQPRISQMDTMLQHARMYGYRRQSLPYLRVFLPEELAVRFNTIHSSERDLRNQIKEKGFNKIAVNVVGNLRTTRNSVLDPRNITAFISGRQFYPHRPEYRKNKIGTENKKIESYTRSLFNDSVIFETLSKNTNSHTHFESVDIDSACNLIKLIPVHPEEEIWNIQSVVAALQSLNSRYSGKMLLYTRAFGKKSRVSRINNYLLKTGVTGGPELESILSQKVPVLMIFRALVTRDDIWDGNEFWYPSLALPSSCPNIIYNESDYWEEER